MNVNLLYQHTDELLAHETLHQKYLVKDLKLPILLEFMSGHDAYLYELCKQVMCVPLIEKEEILWRQKVVKEAIRYPILFEDIYRIADATLDEIQSLREFTAPKYYQIVKNSKKIITEVQILEIFISRLVNLKNLLSDKEVHFDEEPLIEFMKMFNKSFSDHFIKELQGYLEEIKSIKENVKMTVTGHLFLGFKRNDLILNSLDECESVQQKEGRGRLWERWFKKKERENEIIRFDEVEAENNAKDLVEANLEGIFKALSQFNKQLVRFFKDMKAQFGFYSCCSHLYDELVKLGVSCCFPEFIQGEESFCIENMIDISLAIKLKENVVGNTLDKKNKNLWLITGANQGGKTTFLRSIGLGIIMAQSGLFVSAANYRSKVFTGIYTHFPNEEDESVSRGLLEMELEHLDRIMEVIRKGDILLMNESFATTTEKEGSRIAEGVIKALRKCGVLTIFVTHLFEYADELYKEQPSDVIFYCAARDENGKRTYQLEEGKPIEMGNGTDLI